MCTRSVAPDAIMKVLPPGARENTLQADVCILGAGPVGLCLGVALAEAGVTAIILEAGPIRPKIAPREPEADLLNPSRHAPLAEATSRGLGGTARLWGGRCVPFDAVDFEVREHMPGARWPIRESDVAPFYDMAAELLGCQPARFADLSDRRILDIHTGGNGLRLDRLERWSNEPFTPRVLGRRGWPRGLSVLPEATVTDLIFDASGRTVQGVRLRQSEAPLLFAGCRAVVVACGGLETARLLLSVQAARPRLFGGQGGPLGRYYMGHLSGSIADIAFADPNDADLFGYRESHRSLWRRRLTLHEETQRSERLPNVAFYPTNPRLGDASHGNGALSTLALVLASPVLGPRLLPSAIRRMQLEGVRDWSVHWRNVMSDLPRSAAMLSDVGRQRILKGRRKPAIFMRDSRGIYPLLYHAEHLGAADSRVVLGDRPPNDGVRPLRIDLRFSDADAEGVVRAHRSLDTRLQSSGLGRLVYRQDKAAAAAVLEQARDGFHQIGLARMGDDPALSVVDRDCKVFGLTNLYLAGAAVFPTSGQANPTFFATALALRLAQTLRAAEKAT